MVMMVSMDVQRHTQTIRKHDSSSQIEIPKAPAILSMCNIDFLRSADGRIPLLVQSGFSNLDPYDENQPEQGRHYKAHSP